MKNGFLITLAFKLGGWFLVLSSVAVLICLKFLPVTAGFAALSSLSGALIFLGSLAAAGTTFGMVFWLCVGKPINGLMGALEQLSLGNLDFQFNPSEVGSDFRDVATRLEKTRIAFSNSKRTLERRVSELSQSLETITESEKRYRLIFEKSSDVVVILDLETTSILDVNERFTALFGYEQAETHNLNLGDISAGDSAYNQRSALRWARRSQRLGPQTVEWHARAKNGDLFWVEFVYRIARINEIERLLLVARNINEKKSAEQMQIAVYRIFQAAQASQTIYDLFTQVHGILENLLPTRNFSVALYDPRDDLFTYPFHFDQYSAWPSIHKPDNGLVSKVMREGEALLVSPETINSIGAEIRPEDKPLFTYWLGAPMKTTSGILGVLAIRSYSEDVRWGATEKETFTFLTAQIALAVERKNADDALRKSEARWRTLMENTPQLILTINRAGDILYANRVFMGVGREQLQRGSIFDFIPGKDEKEKQDTLLSVFSDREPVTFDSQTTAGKNTERWYSCNISPVIDDGRVDLAIFNATDISEMKRAEAALMKSELLYRRAIEAAGAVPYYRDHRDGTFHFMGSGIQKITGYSNTEITPQIWDGLIQATYSPGDAISRTSSDAPRIVHDGKLAIWRRDHEIRTRDGHTRWVYESSLDIADLDGGKGGSIGIIQDVSSRKLVEEALRQSEYKFRSIVEQLSEGFVLIDETGNIIEWNRAMEEMLGIRREEVMAKNFIDITSMLSSEAENTAQMLRKSQVSINRGLRNGKSPLFTKPIETWMLKKSGEKIRVQQTIFPISTELGYRVGVLNRDITIQKEAEEQIQRLNDELENRVLERTAELETANKELEAFSYSISHDLRAPLRAIDGFGRILADSLGSSNEGGDAARYLGLIRENAQQMGRLIDDLLSFSRLGRQPLNKFRFSQRELVEQVVETFLASYENQNSKIVIDELPACQGDAHLLKQVWVNLISNAIKFSRRSDNTLIEIGAKKDDDEIIYYVKDNGIGFDMRYVGKLFGVFQRLHRPEDFEGTGVGLAIVQRIVKRHGGRVWADSELGAGACFYFSIPDD